MKILEDEFKKTGKIGQTYILVGSSKSIKNSLQALLEEISGRALKSNPDYFESDYEKFLIEDSRNIRKEGSKKPLGEKRYFVLSVTSFTTEASNALLKTFEDVGQFNHFFLIVPSISIVLPTLRSRCIVVESSEGENESFGLAKKFISAPTNERLKIIPDLFEEQLGVVDDFLIGLITIISNNLGGKERIRSIENIEKFRSYLKDNSPARKQILEHLATCLPWIASSK